MTQRVLVVHQSAELYGSDRSLLDLMVGTDRHDTEFVVCLPNDGPLRAELENGGVEVHITGVIKISRKQFSILGLAGLPLELISALRGISRVVSGRNIDVVYSNTVAVFAGALWAKLHGKPHIWHIREIIRKPPLVSRLFQAAVKHLSTKVICNSHETAEWISAGNPVPTFHQVVWNGVDSPGNVGNQDKETQADASGPEVVATPNILMVGRVNAWKGQDLLLDALEAVFAAGESKFSVTFVGGPPPGQPEWMTQLRERIDASPLRGCAHIVEFTREIGDYYAKADLAVVPSKEPEPFGRVAIEAMAAGLPVVAAAHGGLREIVAHESTGLLVAPNSPTALAEALSKLLRSPELRRRMGMAGRQRQIDMFSLTAYRRGVVAVFDSVTVHA
ncbi:glycosyltransferase family 4 protein [Comamonadaceae bacterium G21597-S1]|nr:glycosyltransferase family 4 protein [Comamonadaceae bacterium G21597-S1]